MSDSVETIVALLREVVGDEIDLMGPIGVDTCFNTDLELESIEFVALAEKVQQRYGAQVDFVTWLSGKDLDEIVRLTIGDVAEFIDTCLSSE
jgi:acyl carrier protein